LTEQTTTNGDVVNGSADIFVPSGDNDTCEKGILVLVAELVEESGRSVDRGTFTRLLAGRV